jgi:hypothetical protein
MPTGELLGTITRLQVHPEFILQDERYDPARLLVTDRVSVTSAGVVGWDGASWVVDVHHAAYPAPRSGRHRPISVGFTPSYGKMHARFGDRAAVGVAAENVIVETSRELAIDDLRSGLTVRKPDGATLALGDAMVASPCREFTSYLLGLPYKAEEEEIAEDRQFLRNGMRGYIFTADSDQPFELAVGDEVLLGSVLVG